MAYYTVFLHHELFYVTKSKYVGMESEKPILVIGGFIWKELGNAARQQEICYWAYQLREFTSTHFQVPLFASCCQLRI